MKQTNKKQAPKRSQAKDTTPKRSPRKNSKPATKKDVPSISVSARNNFYQDGSKKLWIASIISSVALALSAGAAIYSVNHKEQNVYFAAYPDGSMLNLTPLNQPNHKDSIVAAWLGKALVDTFDFNYYNIDKRFSESSSKWFTRDGAKLLMQALRDSGNLDSVIKNQLIVNLTLDSTPMIVSTSAVSSDPNNPFAWNFQVNGLLTYRTQTQSYSTRYRFDITVVRRSMLEDPTGLGIAQLVMHTIGDQENN